jgi:hypothetical protein
MLQMLFQSFKITVLYSAMQYSSADRYQCTSGTCPLNLQWKPWIWRWLGPPKCWNPYVRLHGVTSQKTMMLTRSTMRTFHLPIGMKVYYSECTSGSLVNINLLNYTLLNHRRYLRSHFRENLSSTSLFLSFHFIFQNWWSHINTYKLM